MRDKITVNRAQWDEREEALRRLARISETQQKRIERLEAGLQTILRCMTGPFRESDPNLFDRGGDGDPQAIADYVSSVLNDRA